MPDLAQMLASAMDEAAKSPVTMNSQDLFFKGHITAEEFKMNAKAEKWSQPAKSVDANPTKGFPLQQDAKFHFSSSVPEVDYFRIATIKAEKLVDSVLAKFMPKQINYTLIRTHREDALLKDDPRVPIISIRFTLIDLVKETQQSVATDIPLQFPMMVGNEEDDKVFWKHFEFEVTNQITTVVMQLMTTIISGNFVSNT